jgi:hypothetical protein
MYVMFKISTHVLNVYVESDVLSKIITHGKLEIYEFHVVLYFLA